ncbi:sterol O-acyltransferase 1-like isoform X2 [Lacerta agilis]|uniref:sterol O-acyltransferase 1-like isoform X2 n=1 Tax=Lacerta agilis TaxID=80427 RepID=UPI0014198234|nr:sterol O-acyltransferase 1-like isoform X2 [Lacerta agilis]
MVGEENISVRNRRLTYETAEEKGDLSKRHEAGWSFPQSSNGCVDADHLNTRKMQLLVEAEQMKPAFMQQIGSHFTEFVNGLIAKSVQLESSSPPAFSAVCSEKDGGFKSKGSRAPPEHGKVFVARKSAMDELFEVEDIRTIHHAFIAFFILIILNTLIVDFIDEGRLVLEFDLLVFAFGKCSVVASTWLYMFLFTLTVPYGLFLLWAQGYHGSAHKTIRSTFFGGLFMIFQIFGLGVGPAYIAIAYHLPPASAAIVILEQVRLLMKIYSFIRENAPRILSFTPQKTNTVQVPKVSQYLYFLFAPTLIYRDDYPRNPTIRWSYVATNFAQVLGSLFYTSYLFEKYLLPAFRNYFPEHFNVRELVVCIFNTILPSILMTIFVHFLLLQCWLNAFAEMLRFADRMFYKDWWNSTSYARYFRTWNVVVHDWLYYYAYKDFLWLFGKKIKAIAMLSVFTLSAIVHEYVLAVCFGYFYPVVFCFFMCFGMVFNFILHDRRKGPIWNVILWITLLLGQGIIFCLHIWEWYAHKHCPLKNPTFLDYVKPRSWTCHLKV